VNEQLVLDIGTGTVIGLVARLGDGKPEVLAREEHRYDRRVVREGRIVDVEGAAEVVRGVVDGLADESEINVSTAHFAVPGRGLSVERTARSTTFDSPREIRREDWEQLTRRSRPDSDRVLIDTELLSCRVDGESVETPVGQFGERLSAEWMMNTIPMREIENKRNVITQAGLAPGRVVLEPRAALRATVSPAEFDGSVVVIDFGAGTIDVAHLEGGRVRDYETFLGGGDAVTEEIESRGRMSFTEAEQVKSSLGHEPISYTDVTGADRQLTRDELEGMIIPVLKDQLGALRDWFSERDPELVFLAGGGARFDFLGRLVGRMLDVDRDSVVHGPPGTIDDVSDEKELIRSSADFTALGTLLLVSEGRGRQYLRLTVNGRPYAKLMESESMTAGALREELGFESREPIPESAVMVQLDGDWETFRADHRLDPIVRVGEEVVDDQYELRSGDEVTIEPAEEPQSVDLRARDCLPDEILRVTYGDRELELKPYLTDTNGEVLSGDDRLEDGKQYTTHTSFPPETVLENVNQQLGDGPRQPLWKVEGQFTHPRDFEPGEHVELINGLSVEDTGLGRLEEVPEDGTPISTPLN
jgi:cell division protein FtsA